ncbi:tRNA (5-methylaminomethyl-2-thiouridine)(34)-methyltransferase MnmD [Lutimonas saemankumensis]|uniref:tRNA (5-methylaminomethyl-2-thiouridine)(34)-methyltransferase MnmD n=1 Tax=Lutimonas saemankumensis TaxID=483016 RepID=UPI001CD27A4E|nr:tRNA (5-methylaminomethyl-2-thiouridine)(34)-methyltransferase MnmD [Lutimonas saemankumensis]MCA0932582.1 tRNA (5-methylaminomethyl-2-thiouridine)(34)-methyltransferase MnmD [Lutimonas saemankumensis]
MERKIIKTSDGSYSVYLPEWDENYHSRHGAIQEAYHVFIKHGLDLFPDHSKVRILEMGFGTGLNCMITYLEAKKRNLTIDYLGLEGFPLEPELIWELNHLDQLGAENFKDDYKKLIASSWEIPIDLNGKFKLLKQELMFADFTGKSVSDLIYFDAFGARVQPELWTEEIFKKMYEALDANGVLVTYSAKGSVRRAMQAVGFTVERLPGPPGKREMLRGIKAQK